MSMYWISNSNMMTTLTAKYDLKLGQHAVNFLVGTSYEHYKSERLYSKRTDFVSDGLEDIEQGNNFQKIYLMDVVLWRAKCFLTLVV